jgi:hypothetical protein
MRASIGDKLVIKRHHLGEHERVGIVRGIHGADGHPPWVVEWSDRPGEHIFFPGPDAEIEHFEHPERATSDRT